MAVVIKQIQTGRANFGEKLQALRQNARLSLSEVEARTKIQLKYLKALESNDFQSLSEPAYAKYLIKTYVSFLRGDVDYFLNCYQKERGTCDFTQPLLIPKPRVKKSHLVSRRRLVSLGTTALVSLLIFGYLGFQIRSIIKPPELAVFEPTDGFVTENALIKINGSAEDGSEVWINNRAVYMNSNNAFETELGLSRGTNLIQIRASKRYSKEAIIYRRVILEEISPVVRIF